MDAVKATAPQAGKAVTELRKTGWRVTVGDDVHVDEAGHGYFSKEVARGLAVKLGGWYEASTGGLKEVVTGYEPLAAEATRHGVEDSGGEVMPLLHMLQFRVPGRGWMDGTAWMSEKHMTCTIAELLERYQRHDGDGTEWRALSARPAVVPATTREPASQAREPADHSLASAEPERPCQSTYASDDPYEAVMDHEVSVNTQDMLAGEYAKFLRAEKMAYRTRSRELGFGS